MIVSLLLSLNISILEAIIYRTKPILETSILKKYIQECSLLLKKYFLQISILWVKCNTTITFEKSDRRQLGSQIKAFDK